MKYQAKNVYCMNEACMVELRKERMNEAMSNACYNIIPS